MANVKTFLSSCLLIIISWSVFLYSAPQTDFLLTPTNGETGISIAPSFTWTPVAGAAFYTIRISTAGGANFDANVIYTETNINTAGVQLSEVIPVNYVPNPGLPYPVPTSYAIPLGNDRLYYWQVEAHITGTNPKSDIWSFRTYGDVTMTLVYPGSGSTVSPTEVLFSYYPSVAAIGFDYKLEGKAALTPPDAKTGGWVTLDFAPAAVPEIAQTIPELVGGTKYYWRVVLLEESTNKILKYSPVRHFTTSGGATKPVPSYPLSGTVYTNTPILYWYLSGFSTDLTFEIQVSTTNSGLFTKTYPLIGEPAIEDLFFEIPEGGCLPGTKYYWRVRSVYTPPGGGTPVYSDPSDWKNFTTHGAGTVLKPICSYPKGNTTVYTTVPTLYWYVNGSSEGLLFDIEIRKSSEPFTGTATAGLTNIEGLSKQLLVALEPGTTYKWKVCAKNTSGATPLWSDQAVFKVTGGPANSHTVVTYPKNYTTLYTKKPVLWWYLEGSNFGVTGYDLKYKQKDESNWTDLATISGAENTSYEFPTEIPDCEGEKYDWKVAAVFNGSVTGSYSAGSFKIVAGSTPGTPVLVYPKNTTVFTASPTLYWYVNGSTANVTGYNVMYSYSSQFSPPTTVTGQTTDQFFALENLNPGFTYWWKVQLLVNGVAYGDYSDPVKFVVNPGSNGPSTPIVGGPDNISITTTSPIISWAVQADPPTGATYNLEIADNPDFTNAVSLDNLSLQNQEVQGLNPNSGYFWRVRMKDAQGNYSYYSPTAQFMVLSPTGVEDEIMPGEFRLDQNYPNPFNPSTTIKFALPTDANVKLTVFNTLGEKISDLLNGQMSAGTHIVEFNAASLPSGIYFYRIETDKFSAIRKMILMK